MELSGSGPFGKWGELLLKYERGELQKPEVVALLRSGEPVTVGAQPMLADIIENSGKPLLNSRPRKLPRDPKTATGQMYAENAEALIESVATWIKKPSLLDDEEDVDPQFRKEIEEAHRMAGYKNRKWVTAKDQAKKMVADFHGVSETSLRNFIKAAKKQ